MGDAQGFDTLQIHGGAVPDTATCARQVPLYGSTAFVFRDAAHAAALFGLKEVSYIYSRLTNRTIAALQTRIAMLADVIASLALDDQPIFDLAKARAAFKEIQTCPPDQRPAHEGRIQRIVSTTLMHERFGMSGSSSH
jgi:hypothetical protein